MIIIGYVLCKWYFNTINATDIHINKYTSKWGGGECCKKRVWSRCQITHRFHQFVQGIFKIGPGYFLSLHIKLVLFVGQRLLVLQNFVMCVVCFWFQICTWLILNAKLYYFDHTTCTFVNRFKKKNLELV